MARPRPEGPKLPKGVEALPESRGIRRYRATVRRGKGVVVNLGLYDSPWHAAAAVDEAVRALHGPDRPPIDIPKDEQPSADEVRRITERVRERLGLGPKASRGPDLAPAAETLMDLLATTLAAVGRAEVAAASEVEPALDRAARRLVRDAEALFWCRSAGHPPAAEALAEALSQRLDRTLRRGDAARGLLADLDGDAEALARWLVHPDAFPGRRARGFRAEVEHLYKSAEPDDEDASDHAWAATLGIAPPFTASRVRAAYRERSKLAHPDAGGSAEAFVRLQAAYEQAMAYCDP